MVSAKLHLIWLSEELKTVHRFCSIFKRNLQFLCLQWKWFHPQLTIRNVPQSAQSPKRTPEVSLIGSNSLTFQLLPKSIALWDLSCICTLPSLISAPNALQASVFSRLDSTTGPCLSPCLRPSRTPVYSLYCSHGSFSKIQMWAPHSSLYTLPCLPVPSVLNLSSSECQSRLHNSIQ